MNNSKIEKSYKKYFNTFLKTRSTHSKLKKILKNKDNREIIKNMNILPEGYGKICSVKKNYIVIRTNKKFRVDAEDKGDKFINKFICENLFEIVKQISDEELDKNILELIFDFYIDKNKLIIEF